MGYDREQLTQKRLKELLHYDSKTGFFTRKITVKYNAKKGSIIGPNKTQNKYSSINIDGKQYFKHRLVWLYVYGYFPENDIDHINQIKNDDRISNLREVSRSCNMRNTKNKKRNKSGIKGVYWHKFANKWGCINYDKL